MIDIIWEDVRNFCYFLSNDKQINSNAIKYKQIGDCSIRFVSSYGLNILDIFEMSYIIYTIVFIELYDDTCIVYVKSYDFDLSMKLYQFDINDNVEDFSKSLSDKFMKFMDKK